MALILCSLTEHSLSTLRMIAELEGQAEAYVHGHQSPTDLQLGLLNPSHARALAKAGWLEHPQPDAPLRLTSEARSLLS